MKKEIRVLGIDDSPLPKHKRGRTLVIGTVFRGGSFIDGILSTKVTIDGNDSTDKLIKMINSCKFKPQLQCILLDGIALGGFNIIDIGKLNKVTNIPVIVVIRKYPDFKKIKNALVKLKKEKKYKLIQKAGEIIRIGKVYAQLKGINEKLASQILSITSTRSNIPEPIRIAHLIAAGVAVGESKGRA